MTMRTDWLKNILAIVLFAGLFWLLWTLRMVIYYFLAAMALSFILRPVVDLMDKIKIGQKRIPRTLSTAVVLVGFLVLIGTMVSLTVPFLAREAALFSQIDVAELLDESDKTLQLFNTKLEAWNLDGVIHVDASSIQAGAEQFFSKAGASEILNGILSIFGNGFVALFSVLFIGFFLISDSSLLSQMIYGATPDKYEDAVRRILLNSEKLLTRYFVGLLLQITVVTALLAGGMWMFGVEYALLLAVIAGLFNLIPYVGPMIGAFIAVATTFFVHLDDPFMAYTLPQLLRVAGVFAAVQLFDNLVNQPLIFANSVRAHPLEIFLVISIFGTLAGIGGMILAIPFYTLIRVVAREFFSNVKAIDSLTKSIK